MKRLIFGLVLCILFSIVYFNRDNITYFIVEQKSKNFDESSANVYTTNYKFNYVSSYNKIKLHNNEELTSSIYSFLNNGNTIEQKYCAKEYENCLDDLKKIANNQEELSLLNNFVHPFNSFNEITFEHDNYINISLTKKNIYSDTEINLINQKIDVIMESILTKDMTITDKIKSFHDYIINNTKYDTLKSKDINDPTYKSNTAYGVLFEGYGICSGYADVTSIFLYKLGIPNYKISNDNHIWNLVKIDKNWLHLDLTWDDPIINGGEEETLKHDYFLIDTTTLESYKDGSHHFNKDIFKEAN